MKLSWNCFVVRDISSPIFFSSLLVWHHGLNASAFSCSLSTKITFMLNPVLVSASWYIQTQLILLSPLNSSRYIFYLFYGILKEEFGYLSVSLFSSVSLGFMYFETCYSINSYVFLMNLYVPTYEMSFFVLFIPEINFNN